MGNIGVTEILLIAVVALLLFGAGRIADIGKGLGQGIKNFKQGLKEAEALDAENEKKDDKPAAAPPKEDKEAKA
jgi:sec-independent protein translocase protein TatA